MQGLYMFVNRSWQKSPDLKYHSIKPPNLYLSLSQSVSVFDGEAKSRGEGEHRVFWESGCDLKNRGLNSNDKQMTMIAFIYLQSIKWKEAQSIRNGPFVYSQFDAMFHAHGSLLGLKD